MAKTPASPAPADVPADAMLIRRTRLNDNDAAGRPEYDNWTRKLGLLEELRHFDAGVYRRLMAMAADFQAKAAETALEPGFPRIGLVNGRQLVDLLVEHWADIPPDFQERLGLKPGLVRV